ncbi:unnamed protein product [Taenia asiatica]|uniref:Protein sleepless n=1 Tax=Taenia asiatica TaxID=60517 RepID=A0A158R749_TAEAS|nr:unnamed protein product [Taenia asiatica]
MTFHRRCTLFFLDLFSILALIALGVEILGPWMLEEDKSCHGIAFECSTCESPTRSKSRAIPALFIHVAPDFTDALYLSTKGECDFAIKTQNLIPLQNIRRVQITSMRILLISETEKYFLISLIAASAAGCIVAIMTVLAVIMSCCSCSASSSCSHSMYRFTLAYILLDVLALIANIVAMALWVVMKKKEEKFGPSFWVGWAANALLLILLVILICLRTRGGKGEGYEEYESQTSVDQPLFRSFYGMTSTTVFKN